MRSRGRATTETVADARQVTRSGCVVAVREVCREELFDGTRCNAPAEVLLWGKLLPAAALGPRCYDHAAKHVGHQAVHDPAWAILDLRGLAYVNRVHHDGDHEPGCLRAVEPEASGATKSDPVRRVPDTDTGAGR